MFATGRAADAQAVGPNFTIERFSFDVVAGSGARTGQSAELYFGGSARETFAQFSGSMRIGSADRLRGLLTGEYAVDMRGDQVAVCGLAPNGSCYQYFPRTSGPALALGVEVAANRRMDLSLIAGARRSEEIMPFVSAKASLRISRHFGAVAEIRHLAWHDANDRWLWYQPIGIGVRIH